MIRTLVTRRYRRSVARLALLAMWLVVAGPLIGQLSAAGPGHHVEHHHAQAHAAGHRVSTAEAPASTEGGSSAAVLHWQVACGYCTLFQQMPVLSALLPGVVPLASHAITAPVVATRAAHGGPAVFPQAPTRAPPRYRS
ncbi:DUF2946 domain-containing protein [Halomonas sp. ND22Bw]|uniref:DUF2946 domain-containing protein n=1 Tax=Halomonas salina TaxID=42565 RepID=A0ABR4WX84_9GAMM|nr:DUF2946 domain-containing protein [Halomonas salina]KGE79319.1 hypothetical protein FP66_11600 [Halomonas salina]PSJ21977.1 DUF2946 domain-containing protein [Halomonas sp. ND22Bw]